MASPLTHKRKPVLLTLIAISKLIKSALLVTVGVLLVKLHQGQVEETLIEWVRSLHLDPDRHILHAAIEKITGIPAHKLHLFSVATFIYAALYLTEGLGLLFDALWAEWLTIITTAGFIPLEIYELIRVVSVTRITILVINIFILAYLIYRLRARHKERLALEQKEKLPEN